MPGRRGTSAVRVLPLDCAVVATALVALPAAGNPGRRPTPYSPSMAFDATQLVPGATHRSEANGLADGVVAPGLIDTPFDVVYDRVEFTA